MEGANPKIKDVNCWGPLDEAISQVNKKISFIYNIFIFSQM